MDELIPTPSFITVIAAAILCAAVLRLSGNSSASKIIKLVTAVFMLLTLIDLVADVELKGITDFLTDIDKDADAYIAHGEIASRDEIEGIIKERVTAYILDRARHYKAELQVQIDEIDQETMIPQRVYLFGRISPAARNQLIAEIEKDLGIPEEKQIWK